MSSVVSVVGAEASTFVAALSSATRFRPIGAVPSPGGGSRTAKSAADPSVTSSEQRRIKSAGEQRLTRVAQASL